MDLQKTLTNAGRKLAPGLAVVYDTLKNAQDIYNDMRHYDQYRTRERVQNDAINRIYQKINNINEDTSRRNEDYAYYNDLVQKWLANDYEKAYRDEAYNAILNNRQAANELYWKLPANNYELFNMVANVPTKNPITEVDQYSTKEDLLNRQIDLIATEQAILDNYWSDKDGTDFAHKKFLRETQDERDRNKKTLEDLWYDMDYVRAAYYNKYPTPQMLWAQELAWRLDNWMKNKLWVNDSAQAEENEQAKKLIINELTRMVNTWEVEVNPSRAQKLIDLYNKIK